jgi:hypothetical protein
LEIELFEGRIGGQEEEERMALKGRAFLAIWHDIAEESEAEYSIWHTRQHMPERLGVPGFLVGRRAVDWTLDHQRWFTLYETATLEVLSSPEYRARLERLCPDWNRGSETPLSCDSSISGSEPGVMDAVDTGESVSARTA